MSIHRSLSASPMDCPDACSPMHLVVRFNSSIAGAVTAIEGVIGEIPIFDTFCSPCSYAVPIVRRAPLNKRYPKREDSGAQQRGHFCIVTRPRWAREARPASSISARRRTSCRCLSGRIGVKRSFNERSLNTHLSNVVAPYDHAQCFHIVILL